MFRRLTALACLLSYGLLSIAGSGLHLLPGQVAHDPCQTEHASGGSCSHGHHHPSHGHSHSHGHDHESPTKPSSQPEQGWQAAVESDAHHCAVCSFLASTRHAPHAVAATEQSAQFSTELTFERYELASRFLPSANARAPPVL